MKDADKLVSNSLGVMHLLPSVILLAAGFAKLYSVHFLDPSNFIDIPISVVEILSGLGFLFVSKRVFSVVQLLLFGTFTGYLVSKINTSSSSCGCFGSLHSTPEVMVLVDIACTVFLISFWRKSLVAHPATAVRLFSSLVFCSAIGYLYGIGVSTATDDASLANYVDGPSSRLSEVVEGMPNLQSGSLSLLFVRGDCTKCERAVLEATSRRSNGQLLVVQVDEGPMPKKWLMFLENGSLRLKKSIFIETPSMMTVKDGVVLDYFIISD